MPKNDTPLKTQISALADAYDIFTKGGYTGTQSDFINLMKTNSEARTDAYNEFISGGYTGTIDDFSALIGVSKKKSQPIQDDPPQAPVEKVASQSASLSDGKPLSAEQQAAETLNRLKGLSTQGQAVSQLTGQGIGLPQTVPVPKVGKVGITPIEKKTETQIDKEKPIDRSEWIGAYIKRYTQSFINPLQSPSEATALAYIDAAPKKEIDITGKALAIYQAEEGVKKLWGIHTDKDKDLPIPQVGEKPMPPKKGDKEQLSGYLPFFVEKGVSEETVKKYSNEIWRLMEEDKYLINKIKHSPDKITKLELEENIVKAINRHAEKEGERMQLLEDAGVVTFMGNVDNAQQMLMPIANRLGQLKVSLNVLSKDPKLRDDPHKIEEYNATVKEHNSLLEQYLNSQAAINNYIQNNEELSELVTPYLSAVGNIMEADKTLKNILAEFPAIAEKQDELFKNSPEYLLHTDPWAYIKKQSFAMPKSFLKVFAEAVGSPLLFADALTQALGGGERYGGAQRQAERWRDIMVEPYKDEYLGKGKFFRDDGSIYWEGLSLQVAEQAGLVLAIAAMSAAINPMGVRGAATGMGGAGVGNVLTSQGGRYAMTKATEVMRWNMLSTTMPMAAATFDERRQEALNMGYDDLHALGYASTFSLLEGLSELIFPDARFFSKPFRAKMMKAYADDLAKKGVNVAKRNMFQKGLAFLKQQGWQGTLEFGEEVAIMIADSAYQFGRVMEGKAEKSDILPDLDEVLSTMVTVYAVGLGMGARTTMRSINNEHALTKYHLAQNYDAASEYILGSPQFTEEQKAEMLKDIRLFQAELHMLPTDLGDVTRSVAADILAEIKRLETRLAIYEEYNNKGLASVTQKNIKELESRLAEVLVWTPQQEAEFVEQTNTALEKQIQEKTREAGVGVEQVQQITQEETKGEDTQEVAEQEEALPEKEVAEAKEEVAEEAKEDDTQIESALDKIAAIEQEVKAEETPATTTKKDVKVEAPVKQAEEVKKESKPKEAAVVAEEAPAKEEPVASVKEETTTTTKEEKKEPWEMTTHEYIASVYGEESTRTTTGALVDIEKLVNRGKKFQTLPAGEAVLEHEAAVKKAIRQKKAVPQNVVDEYNQRQEKLSKPSVVVEESAPVKEETTTTATKEQDKVADVEKATVEEKPTLQDKKEAAKQQISDALGKLGNIQKFSGEQRESVVQALLELFDGLAKLTALKGEELLARAKQTLKERGRNIPDDIIQEAYQRRQEAEQPPPPKEEKKEEVKVEDDKKEFDLESKPLPVGQKVSKAYKHLFKRADAIGDAIRVVAKDQWNKLYKTISFKESVERGRELLLHLLGKDNDIQAAHAQLVRPMFGKDSVTFGVDPYEVQIARQLLMNYYGQMVAIALEEKNTKDIAKYDALAEAIWEAHKTDGTKMGQGIRLGSIWQYLPSDAVVVRINNQFQADAVKMVGVDAKGLQRFADEFFKALPASIQELLEENKKLLDQISALEKKYKGVVPPSRKKTAPEVLKEAADNIRKIKPSKILEGVAFADPTGIIAIIDGAVELVATTLEATGNVINAVNQGVRAIQKSEAYKKLKNESQEKLIENFKNTIRDEYDFDIEQTKTYKKLTTAPKEKKTRVETPDTWLRDAIQEVIKGHLSNNNLEKSSLETALVEDVGLTRNEAAKIVDAVHNQLLEKANRIKEKIGKESPGNPLLKDRGVRKFITMLLEGDITNETFMQAFADKFGLKLSLSAEEKAELKRLAEIGEAVRQMGRFEAEAHKNLLRYIEQLTPKRSWFKILIDFGLTSAYSNMLSGIQTHRLNILTAGANILARPITDVFNPYEWIQSIEVVRKEGIKGWRRKNPFIRLMYNYKSYQDSLVKVNWVKLQDLILEGKIDEGNKYLNDKMGESIPSSEKQLGEKGQRLPTPKSAIAKVPISFFNTFHRVWNRYVPRLLFGEDIVIRGAAYHANMVLAVREKLIKEQDLKGKELRRHVFAAVNGEYLSQEQRDAVDTQLQEEVDAARASGLEVKPRHIKIRKSEIVESRLQLTDEERFEMMEMARGDIYMDRRTGIYGWLASVPRTIASTGTLGQLLMLPVVPFTTVLGNLGDYMLDSLPVYGHLRARGLSPTGLAVRVWHAAQTDSLSELLKHPVDPDVDVWFGSAQLGLPGSKKYEQQIARANTGMAAMALAMGLGMAGDDDDEESYYKRPIAITGGLFHVKREHRNQHPVGPYVIQIRVPWRKKPLRWRYVAYPFVSIPLGIVGNYNDSVISGHAKESAQDEMIIWTNAFLRSLGQISETSIAIGIQKMVQLVNDAFDSRGGDDQPPLAPFDETDNRAILRSVQQVFKKPGFKFTGNVMKEYGGLLGMMYNPLRNNFIQQGIRFAYPESKMRWTTKDLIEYTLGVNQIVGDTSTDIFGFPIRSYPGNKNFIFPSPVKTDEEYYYWDNFFKYNLGTYIKDVPKWAIRVIDGEYRRMDKEEYMDYKEYANLAFRNRFRQYIEGHSKDELSEKFQKISVKKGLEPTLINQVQIEVGDMWSKTRGQAFDYKFIYKEKYPDVLKPLLNEGLLPKPIKSGTFPYSQKVDKYNYVTIKTEYNTEQMMQLNTLAIKIFAEEIRSKQADIDAVDSERKKDIIDYTWSNAKSKAKRELHDKFANALFPK